MVSKEGGNMEHIYRRYAAVLVTVFFFAFQSTFAQNGYGWITIDEACEDFENGTFVDGSNYNSPVVFPFYNSDDVIVPTNDPQYSNDNIADIQKSFAVGGLTHYVEVNNMAPTGSQFSESPTVIGALTGSTAMEIPLPFRGRAIEVVTRNKQKAFVIYKYGKAESNKVYKLEYDIVNLSPSISTYMENDLKVITIDANNNPIKPRVIDIDLAYAHPSVVDLTDELDNPSIQKKHWGTSANIDIAKYCKSVIFFETYSPKKLAQGETVHVSLLVSGNKIQNGVCCVARSFEKRACVVAYDNFVLSESVQSDFEHSFSHPACFPPTANDVIDFGETAFGTDDEHTNNEKGAETDEDYINKYLPEYARSTQTSDAYIKLNDKAMYTSVWFNEKETKKIPGTNISYVAPKYPNNYGFRLSNDAQNARISSPTELYGVQHLNPNVFEGNFIEFNFTGACRGPEKKGKDPNGNKYLYEGEMFVYAPQQITVNGARVDIEDDKMYCVSYDWANDVLDCNGDALLFGASVYVSSNSDGLDTLNFHKRVSQLYRGQYTKDYVYVHGDTLKQGLHFIAKKVRPAEEFGEANVMLVAIDNITLTSEESFLHKTAAVISFYPPFRMKSAVYYCNTDAIEYTLEEYTQEGTDASRFRVEKTADGIYGVIFDLAKVDPERKDYVAKVKFTIPGKGLEEEILLQAHIPDCATKNVALIDFGAENINSESLYNTQNVYRDGRTTYTKIQEFIDGKGTDKLRIFSKYTVGNAATKDGRIYFPLCGNVYKSTRMWSNNGKQKENNYEKQGYLMYNLPPSFSGSFLEFMKQHGTPVANTESNNDALTDEDEVEVFWIFGPNTLENTKEYLLKFDWVNTLAAHWDRGKLYFNVIVRKPNGDPLEEVDNLGLMRGQYATECLKIDGKTLKEGVKVCLQRKLRPCKEGKEEKDCNCIKWKMDFKNLYGKSTGGCPYFMAAFDNIGIYETNVITEDKLDLFQYQDEEIVVASSTIVFNANKNKETVLGQWGTCSGKIELVTITDADGKGAKAFKALKKSESIGKLETDYEFTFDPLMPEGEYNAVATFITENGEKKSVNLFGKIEALELEQEGFNLKEKDCYLIADTEENTPGYFYPADDLPIASCKVTITEGASSHVKVEDGKFKVEPNSLLYIVMKGNVIYITDSKPVCSDLSVLLPIELTEFYAFCDHGIVSLHWETATETNNDYFSILRSFDGKVFEEVGRVDGAGNSTVDIRYSFRDAVPNAGLVYYMIRQVDYNGAYTDSKILALHTCGDIADFLFLRDHILVSFDEYGTTNTVRIIDPSGKTLYSNRFVDQYTAEVPYPEGKGVFIISVSDAHTITNVEFVR